MGNSDEFKLADTTSQGKFHTFLRILGRIVDGRTPEVADAATDPMLRIAVARLPRFVCHAAATSANAEPKYSYGSAALKLLYPTAKAKADQGSAVWDDVALFSTWSYLAAEYDRKLYIAMTESVKDAVGALAMPKRKVAKKSVGAAAKTGEQDS